MDICPLAAVLRGTSPGPFCFLDSHPLILKWNWFGEHSKRALKYCGHSFCIGVAMAAASKGVEDCIINTLGR